MYLVFVHLIMEIMGIKFAPLSIPLERRLQTFATTAAIFTLMFGGVLSSFLLIYLTLFTKYWQLALIYLIWTYVIDIETCDQGGRRSNWVSGWTWWKYFMEYFPIRLERVPWAELDPKRNYLFCFYPHGILPLGLFSAFASSWGGFQELFPNHTPYPITLKLNFYFPILRELVLAVGGCSPSRNSLNWILGSPGGGKVAILVVGGAAEAFNCNHGEYRIILKKRKGFVKIALTNGTPLVPVFSFGETNLYDQLNNPFVRNIQEWIKKKTGVAPVLPMGRGFFQYSFGLVPHRRPIFTIIGKPIEVAKTEEPTQEQIDNLHAEFMKKLMELFEEQKYNYVPDPHNAKLIIE